MRGFFRASSAPASENSCLVFSWTDDSVLIRFTKSGKSVCRNPESETAETDSSLTIHVAVVHTIEHSDTDPLIGIFLPFYPYVHNSVMKGYGWCNQIGSLHSG